jgi:hypothetical protein
LLGFLCLLDFWLSLEVSNVLLGIFSNSLNKNFILPVLNFRSLPASTGNDSNNNTAVTTTAQPNKASLCNLIPGLLIFSIVVIKFIAPNKLLIPDKCKPNIAKSTLGPL